MIAAVIIIMLLLVVGVGVVMHSTRTPPSPPTVGPRPRAGDDDVEWIVQLHRMNDQGETLGTFSPIFVTGTKAAKQQMSQLARDNQWGYPNMWPVPKMTLKEEWGE